MSEEQRRRAREVAFRRLPPDIPSREKRVDAILEDLGNAIRAAVALIEKTRRDTPPD